MGNSAQQIIMKIITEEAAPVTKLRKAVPPNVAAAVAKSLEKLPADRFESAKAFGAALVNPGVATTALRATSSRAGVLRRGSNRLAVALGGIALAASALALWGGSVPFLRARFCATVSPSRRTRCWPRRISRGSRSRPTGVWCCGRSWPR